MALSQTEMLAIREAQLGGHRAAVLWGDALNALHAFAQNSACPAGYDVVTWFSERSDAYRSALSDAIRAAHDDPGRAALSNRSEP